jgi:hypothetical protein
MNDRTRVVGRPRRAWAPTVRTAVGAMIATTTLALTACGGSGGAPSAGGSSSSPSLLAFSQCMRSHGVSQFPDPEPGQTEIKFPPANEPGFGASGSRLWSAVTACRHLLPPGVGAWYPRSEIPRILRGLRTFAECMRNHGILDWPDPKFDSQGRLGFTGPGADIPPGSRTDHVRIQCSHLLPPEVTNLLGVG